MAAAAAAVTVLLPPRIPTTTNVTRCSALPSLPPRVTSTSTTLFSPSLNHFSVSRKSFLLQTRASSEESSSVDANELFTDLKEKARTCAFSSLPTLILHNVWYKLIFNQVEIISSVYHNQWDAVENKSTVLIYGGGALVAVWLSSILVSAINSVPLLPKIMELVGLGYTGWFVYRYLLFKSSRKELATDIEGLKKKITGTE
ncbi:Protein CURVATURE THYLAKOID [Vigna angularis]|uniref:Protein CURVATURE THYLAKOID n=1 Tax=Phaseolus angularis TaxID=3914 RepID=A0A8T0JQS9_PHAAN|nr:Protein CURVATURE THYLAKOID [Vigna angularis]